MLNTPPSELSAQSSQRTRLIDTLLVLVNGLLLGAAIGVIAWGCLAHR
jgi:hypothetical protein